MQYLLNPNRLEPTLSLPAQSPKLCAIQRRNMSPRALTPINHQLSDLIHWRLQRSTTHTRAYADPDRRVIGTALSAWGVPPAKATEAENGSYLVSIDTSGNWMSVRNCVCRASSQA